MRVAYIAAGAGGMYCGSCIHDNTLAAALLQQGTEVTLIPTYTPLRTDEDGVSIERVFYGGVNVYLQEKLPFFRHTPRLVDWLFDRPSLLGWVARTFTASTSAADLGALTVSVLQGELGHQKKELQRLVRWIRDQVKPDVVHLTNSMFAGMARYLKEELGVPVLCSIQGEELFLDALVEPYRSIAHTTLQDRAQDIDGFISPCQRYTDFMCDYLALPASRFHLVRLGINLSECGPGSRPAAAPFTIGYLARIAPEKGLHLLADAYALLAAAPGRAADKPLRLRVAGWLGRGDRAYYMDVVERLRRAGLDSCVDYVGEVDRAAKLQFLQSLDVLSVPAVYEDPKGLYVLEALANGTPVVQPRHGSFPELIEWTRGGLLVEPNSSAALAAGIEELMNDTALRQKLGNDGMTSVHESFSATTMARATQTVYEQYTSPTTRKDLAT
jgi:glycosyltransferase involved in cell wall biosynthesis